MITIFYEDIIPSLITNTTMKKGFVNGVHKNVQIIPNEGYILHDKNLDMYTEFDAAGSGIGEITLGFNDGITSVRYDYDFDANPREFYAVLKTDTK